MKKLLFSSLLALTAFFSMPVASYATTTATAIEDITKVPVKGQVAYVEMTGGCTAVFVYDGTKWRFVCFY